MTRKVSPVDVLKDELIDKLIDEIEDTGDESHVQFLSITKPVTGKELEQRIKWYEEDHPKCEILYVCTWAGTIKDADQN